MCGSIPGPGIVRRGPRPIPDPRSTREAIHGALLELLAGRAAEEVLLGGFSGGSGGSASSDLAMATCHAVALETALGLGTFGPMWQGLPTRDTVGHAAGAPARACRSDPGLPAVGVCRGDQLGPKLQGRDLRHCRRARRNALAHGTGDRGTCSGASIGRKRRRAMSLLIPCGIQVIAPVADSDGAIRTRGLAGPGRLRSHAADPCPVCACRRGGRGGRLPACHSREGSSCAGRRGSG